MAKKIFTSQKIVFKIDGRDFSAQGLISSFGAKHLFEDDDIPPELFRHMGEELTFFYREIQGRGRLMRETTTSGSMFNLRFIQPSPRLLRAIDNDILETGLRSPWVRMLPRLSTDARDLPGPALIVIDRAGKNHFLYVNNFTLGGMLVEFIGNDLRGIQIGSKLDFDIVTNSGEKLMNVSAIVAHITSERTGVEQQEAGHYFFGLKFLPMTIFNETKYRALIREHCAGLHQVSAVAK